MNWIGCNEACAWAGGHICKEKEWNLACKFSDSELFPYGSKYIEGVCNLGLNGEGRSLAAPGAYRGCEGGIPGVFDILGNVGEWLQDGKGDSYRKFRASSVQHNGPLSLDCTPRCGGNQKTFSSPTIGCRCSKEL